MLRQRNIGKKHSEESKKKMSQNRKGEKNHNSRKIICVNTQEIFCCMADACVKYNIRNASSISSCCRGKSKAAGIHPETGGRLEWMYYEDCLKLQENNID